MVDGLGIYCENTTMKPVEIALEVGRGDEGE
jgi:hypothetical protein